MTGNFLVVIDGTPECESAVRYAARRSELAEKELFVIVAIDNQKETHWLGVERKIIEEAEKNTKLLIDELQRNISNFSKVNISYEILHGSKISIVNEIIKDKSDIGYLVIASNNQGDSPGELVEFISKSGFSIPVVVIPGDMKSENIDKLVGINK